MKSTVPGTPQKTPETSNLHGDITRELFGEIKELKAKIKMLEAQKMESDKIIDSVKQDLESIHPIYKKFNVAAFRKMLHVNREFERSLVLQRGLIGSSVISEANEANEIDKNFFSVIQVVKGQITTLENLHAEKLKTLKEFNAATGKSRNEFIVTNMHGGTPKNVLFPSDWTLLSEDVLYYNTLSQSQDAVDKDYYDNLTLKMFQQFPRYFADLFTENLDQFLDIRGQLIKKYMILGKLFRAREDNAAGVEVKEEEIAELMSGDSGNLTENQQEISKLEKAKQLFATLEDGELKKTMSEVIAEAEKAQNSNEFYETTIANLRLKAGQKIESHTSKIDQGKSEGVGIK